MKRLAVIALLVFCVPARAQQDDSIEYWKAVADIIQEQRDLANNQVALFKAQVKMRDAELAKVKAQLEAATKPKE